MRLTRKNKRRNKKILLKFKIAIYFILFIFKYGGGCVVVEVDVCLKKADYWSCCQPIIGI